MLKTQSSAATGLCMFKDTLHPVKYWNNIQSLVSCFTRVAKLEQGLGREKGGLSQKNIEKLGESREN